MRSKEEANDYRYFPDPDLLPIVITDEEIELLRQQLPEMPEQKYQRYMSELSLSEKDATILTSNIDMSDYFEILCEKTKDAKLSANWLIGELSAFLNKQSIDICESPVNAEQFSGLLIRIKDNTISGKIAKEIFIAMAQGEGSADEIIEKKGLKQITDTGAIESIIDDVLANNPKQVEEYKAGKEQLIGFFVGQVMKASKGKANPGQVNQLLKQKL